MVIKKAKHGVCAPKGFKAAGVHVGFRQNKRKKDLALIVSELPCTATAVYTRNRVKGACIKVCKDHLKDGTAQAVLCNSGIANTCAPNGVEVASGACELVAKELGLKKKDIIVCSTGVIGEELTIEPFQKGLPKLAKKLSVEGASDAMEAIMTTDNVPKELAISFMIGDKKCKIGAIAKGSGMVNPNMATTLAFLTTDVDISKDMLKQILDNDVIDSFNQISIDGDTSTNDMMSIMANGMAGNKPITKEGKAYNDFSKALAHITHELARMIAKDGEGATKLIECKVKNAPSKGAARKISMSVISSDLVKSALAYADPNWGRILCAAGYADAKFNAENVDVSLISKAGNVVVCKESKTYPFDKDVAIKILEEDEVMVAINLHDGKEEATAFGCDLTTAYVKFNGKYKT